MRKFILFICLLFVFTNYSYAKVNKADLDKIETLILDIPEIADEISNYPEENKIYNEQTVEELYLDGNKYEVVEAVYLSLPHSMERHILVVIKDMKEVIYYSTERKGCFDFKVIKGIYPGSEVLFYKNSYGYYGEFGAGFCILKIDNSPGLLLDQMFGGSYHGGKDGQMSENFDQGEAALADLDGDGLKEVIVKVTKVNIMEEKKTLTPSVWTVYRYEKAKDAMVVSKDKSLLKKAQEIWPQSERLFKGPDPFDEMN